MRVFFPLAHRPLMKITVCFCIGLIRPIEGTLPRSRCAHHIQTASWSRQKHQFWHRWSHEVLRRTEAKQDFQKYFVCNVCQEVELVPCDKILHHLEVCEMVFGQHYPNIIARRLIHLHQRGSEEGFCYPVPNGLVDPVQRVSGIMQTFAICESVGKSIH